ncbi:MAG: hypothetical protein IPJ98_05270 [Bryobacterales bacterium]|nr:hypothetical protein [Bryobacterales bacterium]
MRREDGFEAEGVGDAWRGGAWWPHAESEVVVGLLATQLFEEAADIGAEEAAGVGVSGGGDEPADASLSARMNG